MTKIYQNMKEPNQKNDKTEFYKHTKQTSK